MIRAIVQEPGLQNIVKNGIFISYKRGADSADARTLYAALSENFGSDRVRMDVDSFPLGEDFVAHIRSEMDLCHVVLVVIGRGFHERIGELSGDGDFMRLELEQALGDPGKKVIPVLFDGAGMPAKAALPEPVQNIVFRGGVSIDHANSGIILRHKLVPDLQRIFENATHAVDDAKESGKVLEDPIADLAPSANKWAKFGFRNRPPDEEPTRSASPSGVGEPAKGGFERFVPLAGSFVLIVGVLSLVYSLPMLTGDLSIHPKPERPSGLQAGLYSANLHDAPNKGRVVRHLRLGGGQTLCFSAGTNPETAQFDTYVAKSNADVFENKSGFKIRVMSAKSFEWRNHEDKNTTTYSLITPVDQGAFWSADCRRNTE